MKYIKNGLKPFKRNKKNGRASKSNPDLLTVMEENFVIEYLIDLHAGNAAIRAGYSSKYAGQQAYELLQKPKIQKAIGIERDKITAKRESKASKVISELVNIRDANIKDFVIWNKQGLPTVIPSTELTRQQTKAIKSISFNYKSGQFRFELYDKLEANRDLGKYHSLFVEKHKHEVEVKEIPELIINIGKE